MAFLVLELLLLPADLLPEPVLLALERKLPMRTRELTQELMQEFFSLILPPLYFRPPVLMTLLI
jgi:hypothetical protein